MSKLAKVIATYAQLVSPNGEGFQGFWVMDPMDGQPIHSRPFKTLKQAKAVAMLENAASAIVESSDARDPEATGEALNIIDAAYREITGWQARKGN